MPTHLQDVIFCSSALELFQKSVSIGVNQCLKALVYSTSVENPLQIALFMQNKPNFHQPQNEPNPLHRKGLRKFYAHSDNEKRTRNEPNSKNARNRPNLLSNKELRRKSRVATMKKRTQNKPNFSRPQK